MKALKTLLVFVAAGLLMTVAGLAASGSQNIIKQKAKDLRDENNARQGVPSAPPKQGLPAQASPAQSPGYSAPAVPTAVVQAQKRLEADLSGIKSQSPITDALTTSIAGSLLALAQTPKPTEATINRLATVLANGYSEKPLSDPRRTRVISTLTQVLNPRKYSQAQLDEYLADIRFTFQAEGLAKEKAVVISDAAKAAITEMQTVSGR